MAKASRSPVKRTTRRPSRADLAPLQPAPATRAAERIAEQLATLIVTGKLAEGDALPSERSLREQLGASRGTVRQAIHKLEAWGLVEVRAGGTTRVGRATDASSLEVIELRYRLGPLDERERRDLAERRLLQGLSLVVLAEARAPREALEELAVRASDYADRGAPESELWEVEQALWGGLARAVGNRLYVRELEWFGRATSSRRDGPNPSTMSAAMRASFYRELFRRLVARDAAAAYYLEMAQLLVRATPASP